ncbi:MAG TPA: flagellar assembly protein FliX, partial [Acetobacteraceae bacterium]|nr:flagellar assembly protein FliX [Acetobacteraceae bacterium]
APAGAVPVSVLSLLALQEAESGAVQDREARRHGTAVLDELSELQRDLLGEGAPKLDRLAALAARPVAAADPALAGVLRAIQLRAGIELARRRPAASG